MSVIEKWAENGEKLTTYSPNILRDSRLTETTRTFMVSCGLPEGAAPSMEFLTQQETLPTISQYYKIDWEGLDNYLVIGYNGSGDPVCIDVTTGNEIVYLNHDNSFERVWINTTIESFSRSLLVYKVFIMSLSISNDTNDYSMRKFSDAEFSILQDEFREIDEKALDPNTFWQMELNMLLWERDHTP